MSRMQPLAQGHIRGSRWRLILREDLSMCYQASCGASASRRSTHGANHLSPSLTLWRRISTTLGSDTPPNFPGDILRPISAPRTQRILGSLDAEAMILETVFDNVYWRGLGSPRCSIEGYRKKRFEHNTSCLHRANLGAAEQVEPVVVASPIRMPILTWDSAQVVGSTKCKFCLTTRHIAARRRDNIPAE